VNKSASAISNGLIWRLGPSCDEYRK